jgi:hypothetical protein
MAQAIETTQWYSPVNCQELIVFSELPGDFWLPWVETMAYLTASYCGFT